VLRRAKIAYDNVLATLCWCGRLGPHHREDAARPLRPGNSRQPGPERSTYRSSYLATEAEANAILAELATGATRLTPASRDSSAGGGNRLSAKGHFESRIGSNRLYAARRPRRDPPGENAVGWFRGPRRERRQGNGRLRRGGGRNIRTLCCGGLPPITQAALSEVNVRTTTSRARKFRPKSATTLSQIKDQAFRRCTIGGKQGTASG